MAQDYYDPSDKVVFDGDLAKAVDLNSINTDVDTAFDLVGGDLDALTALVDESTALAERWTESDQGVNPDPLQPTKYSSRANAEESEAWASGIAGVSTQADGTTVIPYSANEKAIESSGYADNSLISAIASEASNVSAGLSEDAAAQSVLDAQAEVVNCQDEVVNCQDEVVLAAAQVALAEDARDKAEKWSDEAEDVPVEPGQFSAYHWSQKAYDVVAGGAVVIVAGTYPINVDNTIQSEPIVSFDDSYIKKFGGY